MSDREKQGAVLSVPLPVFCSQGCFRENFNKLKKRDSYDRIAVRQTESHFSSDSVLKKF